MNLLDAVIGQLQQDIANNDLTAIEEMLSNVDETVLRNFLPEHVEVDGEEYDGQPDELTEWHDFDPDC